jgi:hypothetical protein
MPSPAESRSILEALKHHGDVDFRLNAMPGKSHFRLNSREMEPSGQERVFKATKQRRVTWVSVKACYFGFLAFRSQSSFF